MEETQLLPATAEKNELAPIEDKLVALYKTVTKLKLKTEESEALTAPFPDEVMEVHPAGHVYLPGAYYRERLNKVLGIGQWGLVLKSVFSEDKNTTEGKTVRKFFQPGILVIRGCMVAEAVGEADLYDDNDQTSAASAWESAKTDLLTRCCKDLSIGVQTKQPTYTRKWLQEWAVQVWLKGKTKPVWRRKDAPPAWNEMPGKDSAGGAGAVPNTELKWLNKYRMGTEVMTSEWADLRKRIYENGLTLTEINLTWKYQKPLLAEIEAMISDAHKEATQFGYKSQYTKEKMAQQQQSAAAKSSQPAAAPTPETAEPKVEGKWYAVLEKCKTKACVDKKAIEYKADIQKDPALRTFFTQWKSKLPA